MKRTQLTIHKQVTHESENEVHRWPLFSFTITVACFNLYLMRDTMFVLMLGCLFAFILYTCVIRPLLFSPLKDIPNAHPLYALTSLWVQWKRLSGQETATINGAFQAKGPIVKLGPKDIAVNIIEGGVKTVYGGGFGKPDWYTFWVNHGLVLLPCRRSLPNRITYSQTFQYVLVTWQRTHRSPPSHHKCVFQVSYTTPTSRPSNSSYDV